MSAVTRCYQVALLSLGKCASLEDSATRVALPSPVGAADQQELRYRHLMALLVNGSLMVLPSQGGASVTRSLAGRSCCHQVVLLSPGGAVAGWCCHQMVLSAGCAVTRVGHRQVVLSSGGAVTRWCCHRVVLSPGGAVTKWRCHQLGLPSQDGAAITGWCCGCLLYTSPSPRDQRGSRMPSSA